MKLPSGPRILAEKPTSNRNAFHATRQPINPERQEITRIALADREFIESCRRPKQEEET